MTWNRKAPLALKKERNFPVLLVAIACSLAVIFTTLFLTMLPFNRAVVARRDFITYWAAGQQLAHHGNPYDPAATDQLERGAGFRGKTSYFMRNPPWALPLALPLGYFGATPAALPWSLLMLAILIVSVRMLWSLFGSASPVTHFDWLGYCFPPALFCVILGQTSILLLFGLTLFLRLHKTRPFSAGAALWFCTLKPHLFLPFAVVLLAWILVSRSYRVLAGAIAAAAAGGAVTAWIDPAAWSQYTYYIRTSVVTREFTPCLGDVLRDAIHPASEWLAFVPAALGCIWALIYFWRRRHTWDWLENGSPLILVSLFVAPFGWIFDQALAIPAILYALSRNPSQTLLGVLAFLYILIEVQIASPIDLHSAAYLWPAPVWLIWYLLARAQPVGAGVTTAMTAPPLD